MFALCGAAVPDYLIVAEEPADDPALPILRCQVAERLRAVCVHFAPGDFVALVDKIARFKRRWQLLEAPGLDVEHQKTV